MISLVGCAQNGLPETEALGTTELLSPSETETETDTDTATDSEIQSDLESETSEIAESQLETATTAAATEEASSGSGSYYDMANQIIGEEHILDMKGITPYGSFDSYTYYSQTAERDTKVNVLLPPNYSEDKEYPVLYILHGFYDNQDWMARDIVGIPQMLTQLYQDGAAEEMIVVLPYIFTSKELPYCTGMDEENCLAYDNFINDLTTDLMPFIESSFSVKTGRENTAITGFSMGGRESLFIGLSRPDLFYYIGACCPAPGLVPIAGSAMHPGQLQEEEVVFPEDSKPRLVFISAGGNDGVVGSNPLNYHNLLDRNGEQNIYDLMPGTSHDNSSVTPHLYKFFSVVFK